MNRVANALRAMLQYFGPEEKELKDLLDPDYWEGSYRGRPSAEYLEYWKVINEARDALGWAALRWSAPLEAQG